MGKNDTFFFDAHREQSKIKSSIVLKYFNAWSKIMKKNSTGNIAYVDLFSGPGMFEDGKSISTPLKILEYCINDEELREKVITVFNDIEKEHCLALQKNIASLPKIHLLKHPPKILNREVGSDLTEFFLNTKLVPTFSFIDPFGYKGLTTNLINAFIKDYGCDCIFFFNYNRINMGLNNTKVKNHMDAIFGIDRAHNIRQAIKGLSSEAKELYILNELAEALSNNKTYLTLPFRFIDEKKNKTSHYLIYVSKNRTGYKIMKEIMATESSLSDDGVANFSYIPVQHIERHSHIQLSLLSAYDGPLESLQTHLLNKYKGQTHTVKFIFENEHIGTRFILKNFKEALRRMERDGLITTNPPYDMRRTIRGVKTMGDNVEITFLR